MGDVTWTPLDGIGRQAAELAQPDQQAEAERSERRAREVNRRTLDRATGHLIGVDGSVTIDPRRRA